MEGIKNIVFDLGGVMIDLDRERCIAEFHKIGFTQIDALIDPYHPKGLFRQLEKGAITDREFYDEMRREIGQPTPDGAIYAAYLSFLDGIPAYKLRMVHDLRTRGFRTYALSNINAIMFPHIRDVFFTADGLHFADYFDRAYLSFEMHALKPSPGIYRAMIADSGMNPAETLFIDDNLANVEAARELGFDVYMPAAREDFRFLFCGE